ncbi:hypothetical protein CORC01_06683 [Colletotrichum orchidophilum]|uniref:Arf-GAP domain-containing protein n=1 Tax=Colletotrichum orchidophilum TaxID=1209926 RepID=A0A1G4B9C7_9PEZI|nr:uncharacterized protein CORC01_06683 [Colletotrichum orchidophilum]OHE98014.1 hypothetical protein CORC01_06683 [Colletotrichum orchidophilum]
MSRRPPNPAAERAAQNQQTIKSLLKLECNKVCSDCKKNKHPRWASWNLGVFICIRCSGIHRGMGTHISRVKSVDLDSWTDEQLRSILSWGNARANKYWEAKLAPGHVPSESKIENFIRTKYELKRWTMDGPIPDPASLDVDGDDDVPLSLVKEKQNVERRESVRKSSVGKSAAPPRNVAAPQPQIDLIGGDDPIPRASTAGPQPGKVPPKSDPAPPKATSTKDSLLGLDFFGEPAAPPRPASTSNTGGMGGTSRPDLKQSILSLYASAPRPQPHQQQQAPQAQSGAFGGMPSPTFGHQQQQSFGGMNDAFSSLSFSNTSSPKPVQADPFASLSSPVSSSRSPPPASSSSAFGGLTGGSFFDSKPAAAPAPAAHQKQPSNSGFGGFGWSSSPAPAAAQPKPAQPTSSMGDLFDLSAPSQPAAAPSKPSPAPASSSVFNLSQPKAPSPAPTPAAAAPSTISSGNWSGSDVWGSNAWSTPDTNTTAAAPAAPKPAEAPKPALGGAGDFGGWGSSGLSTGSFANTPIVPGASGGFSAAPKVAADEEFGGWTSSTEPAAGSGSAKPVGGGSEDLFSNVWQ